MITTPQFSHYTSSRIEWQVSVMSKAKKYTTISIPSTLFKKLKTRIKGTGFSSVSSYVIYVMREIITNKDEGSRKRNPFTEEDEKRVKDRLRALGYLD